MRRLHGYNNVLFSLLLLIVSEDWNPLHSRIAVVEASSPSSSSSSSYYYSSSNYNGGGSNNDPYKDTTANNNNNGQEDEEFDLSRLDPRGPAPQTPPPPPPPPNAQQQPRQTPRQPEQEDIIKSSYTPIDYAFPSKDKLQDKKKQQTAADSPPKKRFFRFGAKNQNLNDDRDEKQSKEKQDDDDWFDVSGGTKKGGRSNDEEVDRPWVDADLRTSNSNNRRRSPDEYASARRDPVARYMSQSTIHRFTVYLWASLVGGGLGGYLTKSLLGNTSLATHMALFLALSFGLTAGWARNPYGEWTRAAGLACWFTVLQYKRLRRDYPTGRHLRALVGMGPRRRFPPGTDNPWQYKRSDMDDPDESAVEFEMWSALACMVLVGSLAGGTVPLVPSWMGALGGAASLALLTTRADARGDLCRTAGMRVRQTLAQSWSTVMDDLEMPRLTAAVTRKVLDKILILDRQHKLQDKLMATMSWGFNLVQKTARQARGEAVDDNDDNDYRDKRPRRRENDEELRRRDRRPPPRDRDPRDRDPRDRDPRDRESRDRDPRDRNPRDRDPRDRNGRDRDSPRDRDPRDRNPRDRDPRERREGPRSRDREDWRRERPGGERFGVDERRRRDE